LYNYATLSGITAVSSEKDYENSAGFYLDAGHPANTYLFAHKFVRVPPFASYKLYAVRFVHVQTLSECRSLRTSFASYMYPCTSSQPFTLTLAPELAHPRTPSPVYIKQARTCGENEPYCFAVPMTGDVSLPKDGMVMWIERMYVQPGTGTGQRPDETFLARVKHFW
jgi:hypothetical protein